MNSCIGNRGLDEVVGDYGGGGGGKPGPALLINSSYFKYAISKSTPTITPPNMNPIINHVSVLSFASRYLF